MRIDGRPVHFRSARDALAAGIGMVHQELSIVPSLTVAENVFLGHQPVNGAGVVRWRSMAREAKDASAAARDRPRSRPGMRPAAARAAATGRARARAVQRRADHHPRRADLGPVPAGDRAPVRGAAPAEGRGHQLHLHLALPRGRARGLRPGDGVPQQPAHRHGRRGGGRQALGDRADDRPWPPGARGGARGRGEPWPARPAPRPCWRRGAGPQGRLRRRVA